MNNHRGPLQGSTFFMNDLGIGIKRESHRNVVQDNEFYDTIFDWPWDAVKAGSGLETGGPRFHDAYIGPAPDIGAFENVPVGDYRVMLPVPVYGLQNR